MKLFKYMIAAIISILFSSCYLLSPPNVLLNKNFNGNEIAVLNFSKYGPNLPPEISSISADKLTDALYLNGKFNVIDRANVNDAESDLNIVSPELLSADQIQKLGLKLKANYLILGRIQNVSDPDFFNQDSKKQLYISFRIISVLNSKVVGMTTYKISYTDNLLQHLTDAMKVIADKMASAR